jgi:hypothetical protein
MIKRTLKRIYRSMPWAAQVREQMAFNRLHREPPDLIWKVCAACPERRTEAPGAKIGHQFFVIGGFQTMDQVLNVVDVFDLNERRWTDRIAMPANMPQTHLGRACDEERFIYTVGGQLGPQCHPAVADCFVLDARTKSWGRLPPLPEPRYSPTVRLWRGRLHAISGAKPDRWTSACDHWSIAVSGGKAVEREWRQEVPIPKGGPHRASAICGDRLYVFGGQDGDVKPIAADPGYMCDWDTPSEIVYGDSFMTEVGTQEWKTVSTMPVARSHTESAVTIDQYAVVVGGTEGHNRFSDLILVYDSRVDRWRAAGRLPYPMKTTAVYHEGWLYLITGHRGRSLNDPTPGGILNTVWRAKFNPAPSGSSLCFT